MKICLDCGKEKKLSEFCKKKSENDGYHRYCKKCLKKKNDKWYQDSKEKRSNYYKELRKKKREYHKNYCKNHYENNKEYYREWNRKRSKEDPVFRLKHSINALTNFHLKKNNLSKNNHSTEYLACSSDFYKEYLSNQFSPEMSWKNYGIYWEIDHIVPIDSFNLQNPEQLLKCFHYSNTRPLPISENREKSNKILQYL